jgi:hypothetical protein
MPKITDAQFKELCAELKNIDRLDLWFRGGARDYYDSEENPTANGCVEYLLKLHSGDEPAE